MFSLSDLFPRLTLIVPFIWTETVVHGSFCHLDSVCGGYHLSVQVFYCQLYCLVWAAPKNAARSSIFDFERSHDNNSLNLSIRMTRHWTALHLSFLMVSWWSCRVIICLRIFMCPDFIRHSSQLQILRRPQCPRSTTMSLAPTTL